MSVITERPAAGGGDGGDTATRGSSRVAQLAGVAVWAALLGSAMAWGWAMAEQLRYLNVPPFFGAFRVLPAPRWLLPTAVGAVLVAALPALSRRLPWRRLLLASWVAVGGWAVSLAATTGVGRLAAPVQWRTEYVHNLPALDAGVLEFLSTFVAELPSYRTHTKGHPPGFLLVLYALERLGLPVVPAEAALVIAAGTSAVVAVAVTLRVVAGEGAARRALPFLTLAPLALWVATSVDAFFLGVAAWGVALLALATETHGPRAHGLGLGAGLLLGFGLYLTYGMVPFGAVPLAVVAAQRRWRLLIPAGLAVVAVAAAFTAAGFWWFAGVAATHAEWAASIGAERGYWYFLLANLGVLAFMVGPATAAGIAALRDRRVWWLVGAGLLVLLVSDLGGFERGEVERIWLPFAVWLLPATAALRGRARLWLALQATLAILFQGLVHSPW